jgi:two-component system, OmpR family, sensor histidine kinase KdpD
MNVSDGVRSLALGCVAIGFSVWLFRQVPDVSNTTTVALSFLVVVLLAAARAHLWVAVALSIVSMAALNFFFIPPVGTLSIADPQNWLALFAFLAVSLVASNLSAVARDRTREAEMRRDEVGRLFDLGRDVLLITKSDAANTSLARFILRRFDLEYVAICIPQDSEWMTFESGSLGSHELNQADLAAAFSAAEAAPDVERAEHRQLTVGHHGVRLVPIRVGTRPLGLLAAAGRPIEDGTLDALAGFVALAIERTHFLEQQKSAELASQREELKSALLASLGHDLRTPLTAIRVAADNLRSSWPDERERLEQSELIVTEVDRLTRLFENILEMARIDAGAVTRDARWVAPSEIVDAARSRVDPALRGRRVEVSVESERLVRLDPRLTAAALSQLLENAARYSAGATSIDIAATVNDRELTISVRDHGGGIHPGDLPHVFERFYRSASAGTNRSGTGMGLAIARGLLAVENGRISAENCADGGARFTIVVPTDVK